MARNNIAAQIESADARGQFGDRIDYIRFPYFKNLSEGCRIDFYSPFTVFVGPNGCGKSSALQALYGCPKNYSLSEFWFSTKIDPIVDKDSNDRHCFIYSYSGKGPTREVLKRRSFKKGQPDLFDSSPAIKAYGMARPNTRTLAPLEKNVVYLNFRTAQNAFEKVFHQERPPGKEVREFIRQRNHCLFEAFNNERGFRDGRFNYTHDELEVLSEEEVQQASSILGRKYEGAKIVHHHLYGIWGYSIMMSTSSASYSEAFAGSGEFAVFLLVHEVMSAPPLSLLLLDEPETSLHPGAQKRLREFLLIQCLRKKHQVVVCSHSPFIVEGIPSTWVKVFGESAEGKFDVFDAVNSKEVFHRLGHSAGKTKIFVEDRLAKLILASVINSVDSNLSELIEISYAPGGKNQVMQDLTVVCRSSDEDVFVVFDADVQPAIAFQNPMAAMSAEIYQSPHESVNFLKEELSSRGFSPKFSRNGGNDENGSLLKQRDEMIAYIEKCLRDVYFFPFDLEKMIWNDSVAEQLFDIAGEGSLDDLNNFDYKDSYFEITKMTNSIAFATGEQIDVVHGFFIKAWLRDRGAGYSECVEIVNAIRTSLE